MELLDAVGERLLSWEHTLPRGLRQRLPSRQTPCHLVLLAYQFQTHRLQGEQMGVHRYRVRHGAKTALGWLERRDFY